MISKTISLAQAMDEAVASLPMLRRVATQWRFRRNPEYRAAVLNELALKLVDDERAVEILGTQFCGDLLCGRSTVETAFVFDADRLDNLERLLKIIVEYLPQILAIVMRLFGAFVLLVSMVALPTSAAGQIFGGRLTQRQYQYQPQQQPSCVGGNCPQLVAAGPVAGVVIYDTEPKLTLPGDVEEVSTAIADGPHVRCLVSGSCGSGTICGADARGSYVVSNAHVWGTQIGKVVNVDLVSNGQTKRMQGRIVFSGYSNSRMVDFAIALVPGLTSKVYMPMVKSEPADGPYGTRGSPRCVWPQVTKPFNDARNYGRGLITGTPDAIGGQSGSAIYNSQGQQIALLTWSINGRCAGQKTSLLWQVASERNVNLADLRPDGLAELNDSPTRPETVEGIHCGDGEKLVFGGRPKTIEGIHGQLAGLVESAANDPEALLVVGQRVRPITENVIANQASTSMEDLPIWFENKPVDPTPVDPTPVPPVDDDCHKLTAKEWQLIQFLRKQAEQEGEVVDRDWWGLIIKLWPHIVEIIKVIQQSK